MRKCRAASVRGPNQILCSVRFFHRCGIKIGKTNRGERCGKRTQQLTMQVHVSGGRNAPGLPMRCGRGNIFAYFRARCRAHTCHPHVQLRCSIVGGELCIVENFPKISLAIFSCDPTDHARRLPKTKFNVTFHASVDPLDVNQLAARVEPSPFLLLKLGHFHERNGLASLLHVRPVHENSA